jgi:hypothetical protein
MKSLMPYLALMSCLGVSLAACGASTASHSAQTVIAVHAPGRNAQPKARCPAGRLLPDGAGIAIDYVDFLRFDGRFYNADPWRGKVPGLGPVITHVRCSLIAEEDQRHAEPPLIDGTASYLPAGAPVYEVRGYPPRCRLAAYLHGRLQAYLAQTTVHHQSAALPCALHQVPAKQASP